MSQIYNKQILINKILTVKKVKMKMMMKVKMEMEITLVTFRLLITKLSAVIRNLIQIIKTMMRILIIWNSVKMKKIQTSKKQMRKMAFTTREMISMLRVSRVKINNRYWEVIMNRKIGINSMKLRCRQRKKRSNTKISLCSPCLKVNHKLLN